MSTLQKAIEIATQAHAGQVDKAGNEYIGHPLRVMDMGRTEEEKIVGVLHDVVEDCSDQLPMHGEELVKHGLDPEVLELVNLLSKPSGLSQKELEVYFNAIRDNPKALLIKLSDRLHNSATIYTFSLEKMRKYINETNDFIIPIASHGKLYYPQYTNALGILKSNIYSLNHAMEIMLNKFEERDAELNGRIRELEEQLRAK
jgi:GTP pyrophosphokinase